MPIVRRKNFISASVRNQQQEEKLTTIKHTGCDERAAAGCGHGYKQNVEHNQTKKKTKKLLQTPKEDEHA